MFCNSFISNNSIFLKIFFQVCQTESSRTDKYLDIPLVIRGFGESKAISSVEEALEKFTTPELLNGENQYFCEKCNKKVDATKGLKYNSFPYLLTLQLKRFDFDYETVKKNFFLYY